MEYNKLDMKINGEKLIARLKELGQTGINKTLIIIDITVIIHYIKLHLINIRLSKILHFINDSLIQTPYLCISKI